jgi:hypothetical protein
MGLTAGPHLPVTARKKKREAVLAGPAGGQSWAARAAVRGERRPAALLVSGQEKKVGRLEKKRERRGRKEERKVFFFKKFFSISFFKLSNFNQTASPKLWNHDAQTLIISKLF